MITRSKLVEQLREYQIRSQHKYPALTFFSPKPNISSWADVSVAVLWALIFSLFVALTYLAWYFSHVWVSFALACLGIFLPVRLRTSRQALIRKRDRRLLLPLSM